ncbi:MAG: ABC transporter ATP-binding protein [Betaproteobacteria bacterium]|nr:ABC transporter ATP-binding protein [Betaproteobacteria bacterium]NBY18283.1 ABC transporter ATP-binding protein [Betaproteobacteria bacterium]
MTSPILETRELSVRFGGHVAVDCVSCAFEAGSLTAIVGPNGAGKTTWFNAVSGQLKPSAGEVWLGGENITALSAPMRTRRGLGRAFQLTQLFAQLSVHENLRLAVQAQAGLGLGLRDLVTGWATRKDLLERADALLESVSLAAQRDQLAAALPHGDQRKLEVAILMALQPRVFLLDEPTAGMSLDDVPVILDLIRALKRRGDATILLVEHKMDVIRELADRIVVLHEGRLVADGEPAVVMTSSVVQEAYLRRRATP